jgi:hypothetical protein
MMTASVSAGAHKVIETIEIDRRLRELVRKTIGPDDQKI